MATPDKRYADLPHEVRAFLESLDGESVTDLANVIRFYHDLSTPREGRITPIDFLMNAKARTLEWLKEARKEEVDQLDEAIKLVRSGRTVGRFMKWAVITTIGAFIVMSQFGDAVTKLLGLLRGAPK
jgi:hypothetical protein